MKITSKDILNVLKLQKGDHIIIGKDVKAKVLNDETIELTDTNVLCPVIQLVNRDVTKVEISTRKSGDRRCNEIPSCVVCPLGVLDCTTSMTTEEDTLYNYLKEIKPNLDIIDKRLYPIFKEILDKPI